AKKFGIEIIEVIQGGDLFLPMKPYCDENSNAVIINDDKTSEEFMQIFANMNLADRVAVMQFAFDKIGQNA
ncbi:MAG: hypothetical protein IKI37_02150, partial [Oscillospiraceae bacterium]|nr:hypothetical protein [Oscillospiraceae bacterium]